VQVHPAPVNRNFITVLSLAVNFKSYPQHHTKNKTQPKMRFLNTSIAWLLAFLTMVTATSTAEPFRNIMYLTGYVLLHLWVEDGH
jgi:tellurite resistance protein TehA-like permease